MLILTRKCGEAIMIGDGSVITITVLECKSQRVRIGIDAPKNISVHREEIYRRIQSERQQNLVIEVNRNEKTA